MIIDNKKFDIPTTERARQYMKNQRVRFHLRTPAEGIKDEFTKPCRKKNRMSTGARASVASHALWLDYGWHFIESMLVA